MGPGSSRAKRPNPGDLEPSTFPILMYICGDQFQNSHNPSPIIKAELPSSHNRNISLKYIEYLSHLLTS